MNYGRYHIEKEVGRGSMGVVYRAHDPSIDRTVALKVLRKDRVTSETFVRRFLKEAKAIGRLSHPNSVTVFDIGEDQGTVYIAMEFLEGESLQDVIDSRELGIKEVVDLGIQVAETLDYAHCKGVVHRDIKPSNIILSPSGQIKITDFGIAHIDDPAATMQTMAGEVMGTPAYMSPQQVMGQPTDGRTDLFSLGVILYELCTGGRPFGGEGKGLNTVFNEILRDDPNEPAKISAKVPTELSAIIMKCLNKEPESRFQTGLELAEALRKLRVESVEQPRLAEISEVRPEPALERPRAVSMLVLLGAIFAVAVMGYFVKDWFFAPAKVASVEVESRPTGAGIFVNGEAKGKAPVALDLPLGTYHIKASLAGYEDREVRLELTENRSYPVSFSLQQKAVSQPKPGILKVESTPAGADLHIDGQPQGRTPKTTELMPGWHRVLVDLAGHASYTTQIQLQEGAEYSLSAELVPDSVKSNGIASMSVESSPPGARVFVDGQPRGVTPQKLEVPMGWHHVRLIMEGYEVKEERLQLTEPKPYQLNFDLSPTAQKPLLMVDSDPIGAQVYVNDQYKGKTPLRVRLPQGRYLVRMSYPGRQEWSSQLELGETGEYPLKGRLTAATAGRPSPLETSKAFLNVQSTPPAAQVYVDGTLRGTTPLKVDVPPGKHRVRITQAGYRDWEYQVSVMETREYPINVVLRQLP
jgi:eukaryotic-like serine/threonine-protein kinase